MHGWIEFALFLLVALPVTFFDIREYRIPDLLTFSGVAAFVVIKLLWNEQSVGTLALDLAVGFGVFWLIWWMSSGQMGLGDAKFSAFIAVAGGLTTWFGALFVASTTGLATAAVLKLLCKSDRPARIPFAPFLTLGAAVSLQFQGFHHLLPDFSW